MVGLPTTKREHHELQVAGGLIRVDICETNDAVHVALSGASTTDLEYGKFSGWLFPILRRFDDGHRPLRLSSEHCNFTKTVRMLESGAVIVEDGQIEERNTLPC